VCQAVNDWYRAHPVAERRWLEEFLAELRRDW
jgi:hypothetical protein